MSDFRAGFVTKTIPTTGPTVTAQAPADFNALDDFQRGFLLPACTLPTAGVGRTTGSLNNSLIQLTADVAFDDNDSITFTEEWQSGISKDNLCGAQVLEYRGPPAGPNAVISRGDFTITLGAGVTTVDSAAISGIVTFAKCVPFASIHCTYNSTDYRAHFAKVDLVNTGSAFVVRVTRALGNGVMTVRVRVAEFTGSNWSVQRVAHTFAASNTNEDDAITAVDTARSFTVSTFLPSTTASPTPQQQNYYVWLAGATTLRHRIKVKATAAPSCITWVLSNPLLSVTRYGTPDGTNDLTASGTSPETKTVAVTAVPDLAQVLLLGHAGGDTSDTSGVMCAWWLLDLQNATTARFRRTGSDTPANRGDTEYVLQIVDFSGVISTRIDTITPITDGQSFTIGGIFGSNPSVTHGGDSVTVTGSNSTSITCLASIGTKKYGVPYVLAVIDSVGGTDTTQAIVSAPAGIKYIDLAAPLLPTSNRWTASPVDLVGTEQVRCTGVGGAGVTIADIDLFTNGGGRLHKAAGTADISVNDGSGWGAVGTQTFQQPVAPPVLVGSIMPLTFVIGVAFQVSLASYATGWDTVTIIGSLPAGITNSNGLLSGAGTSAGVYALTARYANASGHVDADFVITISPPLPPGGVYRVVVSLGAVN